MGDIIQFRPKGNSGEEIPHLVLCDSITTLLIRAIEIGLVIKFSVTDVCHNDGDEETHNELYRLYKITIQFPDGKKAQIEQPGYEIRNFLNGLCLGSYLTKHPDFVKF